MILKFLIWLCLYCKKQEKKNPPLLYNLAELQNDCSRMFKLSPDETLKIVQELYEKKLVSIPVVDTGRLQDFEGRCDKYGIYYCCGTGKNRSNRFINMPALRTRMIGFQTYYNNAVGFLHWGFNFWKSQYSLVNINPWLDNDALGAFPAGDAFIVYPGEDGPWDSIRNEILSDAWQDCRLAFLAEKYVGKAAVQKLFADNKMKKIKEYIVKAAWVPWDYLLIS